MNECKMTIRSTPQERDEIQRRAKAANLSVNRYMIASALSSAPRNDRKMSNLMGQLCRLELCVQSATDLDALKRDVRTWRRMTIRMMEER